MLESFDAQSAKTPKGENPTSGEQGKNTKKKSSTSETGHSKNIANFQDLISFCQGYGSIYNPSKESLRITELQNQYQSSLDTLYQLKTSKVNFDTATNSRRIEFESLKPFSTKILSAFIVSGADKLAIDDMRGIHKKIQGPNYKKAKDESKEIKNISTSQQSYDRFIDHFVNLIKILEKSPTYNPNEEDLKISAIQAKIDAMKSTNINLINAYTEYNNAVIQRNVVLYNELTGLVQVSKEVKLYVRSIFGANSPQYQQVKVIEIKTIKN
jgi:hypothetical protein